MLTRARIRRGLQIAFTGAVVLFVGLYLADQWDSLRGYPLNIRWGWLLLSQVLLTCSLGLLAAPAPLILNALDSPRPLPVILRVFFLSNIAKYLPGSIWALPGRVYLYQQTGISTARSAVIVFWEVLGMVAGAALIGLLGLPLLAAVLPGWLLALGAIGMLTGALLAINARRVLPRLPLPARLRHMLDRPDAWLTSGQIAAVMALYALAWLAIGIAFTLMVAAVQPLQSAEWWLLLPGLHAIAWVIGFLVIVAPGGIGVRDALLVLGMLALVDEPLPALVAILARIAWTLAEVSALLLAEFYYRRVWRR
ncbi:MAG: lysylphosphatidylglycerol synthase domain-containing protein [Phototrophicaceae bacterium]